MSIPRHGKYKDSGVRWLGDLPAHWSVQRYKQVFVEREERSEAGQETLLSVSAYTGVSPRSEIVEDGDHLSRAESLEGYKVCYPDDLVVNIMLAWNRGLGFAKQHGIVSPAYSVFKPLPGNCSRFLDYMVRSDRVILYYKAFSSGVIDSRLRLYPESFGSLYCALPPAEEQGAIATFLDRETAKVDALIAEQKKLLTLLVEKRQATISHAITKGINPRAQMKDSGVAWLGEVPAHWSVAPLKYLVALRSGGTPSKDNQAYWGGNIPWASAKDLKVEKLADTKDHITQKAIDDGAAGLVKAGAVLVVVRGMILARIFPVVETLVPMAINQDLKAVLPSNSVSASFLAWLLRGSASESLQRLDEAGHGTKALRMEAWTSMKLPLPPTAEQIQIASFLSEETAKVDALRANAERAISLLEERRSSVIAAAVTGQIDVRRIEPQVTAERLEAIAA